MIGRQKITRSKMREGATPSRSPQFYEVYKKHIITAYERNRSSFIFSTLPIEGSTQSNQMQRLLFIHFLFPHSEHELRGIDNPISKLKHIRSSFENRLKASFRSCGDCLFGGRSIHQDLRFLFNVNVTTPCNCQGIVDR